MRQKLHIYYNFSRRDIEANDHADFLEVFSPTNVPDRALKHLCNALEFRLGGYAKEKREPYLVPEIRAFFRQLDCRLNHALAYYSESDSGFLVFLANCHMDNLMVVQQEAGAKVGLRYELTELDRFIEHGSQAIQWLGTRTGMNSRGISLRQKRSAGYFQRRLGWKAKD